MSNTYHAYNILIVEFFFYLVPQKSIYSKELFYTQNIILKSSFLESSCTSTFQLTFNYVGVNMGIFEIIYDANPHGMYFTGQIVTGRAIIRLDEPMSVKGVNLRVRGYAKVRWEESSSHTNSDGTTTTTTDVYSDKEKYFDTVTECILEKGDDNILKPGVHTYCFQCPLPFQCPSSFEGTHGRIRYETKITIVRPMFKFNKSYTMGFNVLKIFDLNQLSHLRIPASMEVIKKFCCGLCSSRPLIISMDIQKTGFVPGEFVNVNLKMINHSGTVVGQIQIALNLVALYSVRSRSGKKSEKIPIATSKFGAFDKKTMEIKEKIQIPPTPPTCLDLCPIIQITYEVEVTAKVSGAHVNPKVSIPITIGNIPYMEGTAPIAEDLLITNLSNSAARVPLPDLDINIPPPSYEEAVFSLGSNQKLDQPKKPENADAHFEQFTPRYPFYVALSNNEKEFYQPS